MLCIDRKGAVPAASLVAALTLGLAPPAPALGETPTISETFILEPASGRPGDAFGSSVALGDGIAAIGAPRLLNPFGPDGAVFFFDSVTGEEVGSIRSESHTNRSGFGTTLTIRGQTLTVGVPFERRGESISGAVHVYDIATQQRLFVLTPESNQPIEFFGSRIAMNESIIAVSGYRDENRTNRSGSVFLFDRATGEQIAELQPEGGSDGDDFGVSLAISEDRLVVGAYTDAEQGFVTGAAYLFDLTDRSQIAKLFAIDGPSTYFGSSIAMDDHTIAVGNPLNNDNGTFVGAVHLYDASTGASFRRIDPEETADFMGFGRNLFVGDGSVFVATGLPEDAEVTAVRAFDIATGTERALFLPDSVIADQRFGGAIAARDSTVLIGAPFSESSSPPGQAFLFSLSCPGDTTGDGTVDLSDLNLVLANFGQQTPAGDTNDDGVVDLTDLNAVLAAFGTVCF